MKRWFIARMGDYENASTNVPATNKYAPNGTLRSDLLNDPTMPVRTWSRPGFAFCFGQLATSDITAVQADPDVYVLPDGAMDMSVGSIPAQVRQTMRARLEAAGFDFSAVTTQWTVRQVLVYLLQQIQPVLDSVETGDVPDVT